MDIPQKYRAQHIRLHDGGFVSTQTEAMVLPRRDAASQSEALAVLYDNGAAAPEITVTEAATSVFTVRADGAPVAVVASTEAPRASEIRLIERNPDGTAPRLPFHAATLN